MLGLAKSNGEAVAALFAAVRKDRPAVLRAHSFAETVLSFSFYIRFICEVVFHGDFLYNKC